MQNKNPNYINILICLVSLTLFGCKAKEQAVVPPFVGVSEVGGAKVLNDTVSEYYKKDFLRYEDYIYKKNIQTVLLHREGWELSAPVIQLGTDEKLLLSFDDLDADVKNYKYSIIHCSASWVPSMLAKNEYIEGFNESIIDDYRFSFNTIQKYTHYELLFPEPSVLQPLIAGNYIMIVYAGDESDVAFTRRFMIVDPKVTVSAVIKRATAIEYKNYKQEIDFSIDKTGYDIPDIYKNLKVVVTQNGRWDNAVVDLKPLLVKGDILDYNYDDLNVFSGGNEFRHFDIKSIKYYSDRIQKITYENGVDHVYLLPDEKRTFKVYATDKDINGRRLIKNDDATDSGIEGEYVMVHFFLPFTEPVEKGNLYVLGALTDWQFIHDAIAKYDNTRKGYAAELYLKQGYYNYQYVFLEDGKNSGDETLVEGMHYETENDYTIFVYCREQGTIYDKLIAIKQLNSLSGK